MSELPVNFHDVGAAARRIGPHLERTPVMSSRSIEARTLAQRVQFKCENFQRAGAFKFRGATNALLQLDEAARKRGVLAWSSGNHAQAVALAGALLGIKSRIVMPDDAPQVKLEATRAYGAEVILYNRSETTREELGARIAEEHGLTIIPPYDHPHIVAGQGTAALEMLKEIGEIDLLLAPVGGGGLISGSAIAAKAMFPGCRVIGVEPAAADDARRSLKSGDLQSVRDPDTIADGARTPSLGPKVTFPLVRHYVDDIVTVDDDALRRAAHFCMQRMKIVIEPTAALPVAAMLEKVIDVRGLRVGVIISGGNIDLALENLFPTG